MKTIQVNVRQRGGKDFIAESEAKICVGGEEVKNSIEEITREALEVSHPFEVSEIVQYGDYTLEVVIFGKSGESKSFKLKEAWGCIYEIKSEKEIREFLNELADFIKGIEEWMEENSSYTREFCIEVN